MQPEKLTNSGENYQNHGEIKIDHRETVLPNPEIKESTQNLEKEQSNNVDKVRDEFQKIVDKSLKLPKPVSPDHIVVNTAMPVFSFPDSASDNDVIEMEWIKAIKQVLENTKDNPNLRSQQINALQEQYLLMRYGKTLDEKDNRE